MRSVKLSDRELYPSEKQDRFIVRLPDGLRDRIRAAAEANNRSMNAEVVATLEQQYPSPAALEELFFSEIVEWSDRIGDAPDAEKDQLVDQANEWLEEHGLDRTQFVLIRVAEDGPRFPATMRTRERYEGGL